MRKNMNNERDYSPLIIIGGPTGIGKTDLAIQLCRIRNGEIIGADSMQIYKGLDVLSNKITLEERKDISHHMIDLIDISEEFHVGLYSQTALPIIKNIQDSLKTPIVVGGNNYYIESVIYENLVHVDCSQLLYEKMSNQELWDKLREIDPKRAEKLHVHDRRRIRRSLNIASSGILHSEYIRNHQIDGHVDAHPLRNPLTTFIWLSGDSDFIKRRIVTRCEMMLNNGGWEELQKIYQHFISCNMPENDLRGACQVIGFRQFLPLLKLYPSEKYKDIENYLKKSCFDQFVTTTLKYTKIQTRWFKNRIRKDNRISFIEINVSLMKFDDIVDACCQELDKLTSNKIENIMEFMPIKFFSLIRNTCELCQKTCIGKVSWDAHLASKGHKYFTKKKKYINRNVSILSNLNI